MIPELYYIEQMTDLQKEVVYALKEMGYKHKYFTTYHTFSRQANFEVNIDVSKINTLADVINTFYNEGSDQKRFEIQRALGI